MILNSQGFGHFVRNQNNQDFAFETSRMLLILDGCSEAKYSEVGVRLFAQLFSRKEELDSVEKFESNVEEVFNEIIKMMKKYYPDPEEFENEFIKKNLLFTIVACFNTDDKYIVKIFGDGYIIAQNMLNRLSYVKISYGAMPPYFAYRYCQFLQSNAFKNHTFKTYEFDKKIFKAVAIASDGILPCVKREVALDNYLLNKDLIGMKIEFRMKHDLFNDDATVAFFKDDSKYIFNEVKKCDTGENLEEIEEALFGKKFLKTEELPLKSVEKKNEKKEKNTTNTEKKEKIK